MNMGALTARYSAATTRRTIYYRLHTRGEGLLYWRENALPHAHTHTHTQSHTPRVRLPPSPHDGKHALALALSEGVRECTTGMVTGRHTTLIILTLLADKHDSWRCSLCKRPAESREGRARTYRTVVG